MTRRFLLELSTAHLPPGLRVDLSSHSAIVAVEDPGYGWWMWVPDDPDESALWGDELPPVVLDLQHFARRARCDWIRFDVDGDVHPKLPTFPDQPAA